MHSLLRGAARGLSLGLVTDSFSSVISLFQRCARSSHEARSEAQGA